MKEAKITCLIERFEIPQLGMVLAEGQVVWLTQQQYEQCKDRIDRGQKIGALAPPHWQARARMSKPPPPPHFQRIVPGANASRGGDAILLGKGGSEASTAEIKEAVAKELGVFKTEMMAALAQMMAAQQLEAAVEPSASAVSLEDLQKLMEQAVASAPAPQVVVQQGGSALTTSTPKPKDDGPMFIPSNLVPDEVKGTLTVKEQSSKSDGIDDAQAALKALRKKRKKDQNR